MKQKQKVKMNVYKKFVKKIFCFVISSFVLKEKAQLEEQLQDITRNLEESKNYISQLQIQTKKDKRDRAKYIFEKITA